MNNEQQTYVLRKPVGYKVRNEDANEFVEWRLLVVDGEEFQPITKGNFDALFQPFDVSGLTRQVEELLDGDYRSYSDYLDWCDMPPKEKRIKLHSTAEQIVLLLLNQEGETK